MTRSVLICTICSIRNPRKCFRSFIQKGVGVFRVSAVKFDEMV